MSEQLFKQLNANFQHSEKKPSRRILVIVNPYATTVSERLKHLVVFALKGRYDVEYVETQERGHATELAREAARERFDAVVSFSGDGTLNEVANGLIGSETAMTCLPGGSTNVYCRMLGIPIDIVDATEHLLKLADSWNPSYVDIARANERYFLFTSDVGFAADVAEQTEQHPRLKARFRQYYFASATVSRFCSKYMFKGPSLEVLTNDEKITGSNLTVQNGEVYSYFGRQGLHAAPEIPLTNGELSAVVLKRTKLRDVPTMAFRAIVAQKRFPIYKHRAMAPLSGVKELTVSAIDPEHELLPLHVVGDYIGRFPSIHYKIDPAALKVIA